MVSPRSDSRASIEAVEPTERARAKIWQGRRRAINRRWRSSASDKLLGQAESMERAKSKKKRTRRIASEGARARVALQHRWTTANRTVSAVRTSHISRASFGLSDRCDTFSLSFSLYVTRRAFSTSDSRSSGARRVSSFFSFFSFSFFLFCFSAPYAQSVQLRHRFCRP